MSELQKQVTLMPNLRDGFSSAPTPVSGVAQFRNNLGMQRIRLVLAAQAVSLLAANDFGSVKVCDLPTDNLMFMGCVIDLTSTQTGMTSNLGTALTCALGTVATASTNFANAGEKNLVGSITASGGAGVGVEQGSSAENSITAPVMLARGAKAVYLNVADPVTSGTGVATFSGVIDLYYMDIGDHS